MELQEGKKYTIVIIDSGLAMTHRKEITFCGKMNERDTYKEKGKRTKYYLNLNKGFIFEGWDIPIRVDTDTGTTMRGNACFNFVGDPIVIKHWIDTKNLNTEARKGIVLVVDGDKEELLYPELAEETHAVVGRIIKAS